MVALQTEYKERAAAPAPSNSRVAPLFAVPFLRKQPGACSSWVVRVADAAMVTFVGHVIHTSYGLANPSADL